MNVINCEFCPLNKIAKVKDPSRAETYLHVYSSKLIVEIALYSDVFSRKIQNYDHTRNLGSKERWPTAKTPTEKKVLLYQQNRLLK